MSKLLFTAVFLLVATFATAFNYTTPRAHGVPQAQQPEAILVDYHGLTASQANVIRDQLIQMLDMNVNNQDLTNYMWDYCSREDPDSDHLITISKCFDYCYEGTQPKYYAMFDIDRGTNRFMIVGRAKC